MRIRFIRPVDGTCAGIDNPTPGVETTVGPTVGAALISQRMAVPVTDEDVETATFGPDETRTAPAVAPVPAPHFVEDNAAAVEPESKPAEPVKRGPGRPRKNA